jgi:hypothetical protein
MRYTGKSEKMCHLKLPASKDKLKTKGEMKKTGLTTKLHPIAAKVHK